MVLQRWINPHPVLVYDPHNYAIAKRTRSLGASFAIIGRIFFLCFSLGAAGADIAFVWLHFNLVEELEEPSRAHWIECLKEFNYFDITKIFELLFAVVFLVHNLKQIEKNLSWKSAMTGRERWSGVGGNVFPLHEWARGEVSSCWCLSSGWWARTHCF